MRVNRNPKPPIVASPVAPTAVSRHEKVPKKTFVFALNPDKVLENDIVLLLDTPWGHAALCTQPYELFEAMPEGLHRRLVFATYTKKRNQIYVLRPTPSVGRNADGRRVADYAEDLYGHAYNFVGAATAVAPWPRANSEGSYFCSQVIAQIFVNYGLDLQLGSAPDKVKPRDFLKCLKSGVLTDDTPKCLLEIDPAVHALDYECILETAEQSQWAVCEMRMNRQVFCRCMRRLGKAKPKDVYSLRQLWQWLGYKIRPDNQDVVIELQTAVLEAMEGGGYWTFYEQLHEHRQAMLGELKLVSQEILNRAADGERVDRWLRSQQHSGFSLPKRREYLDAFRTWEHATNLMLFKRLTDVFETQTRDTELLREQYETLHSLRGGDHSASDSLMWPNSGCKMPA